MADKGTPEGIAQRRLTEDDDVEGHGHHARDGEGISLRRATGDDGEGIAHRKVTEDDDVEGHGQHARDGEGIAHRKVTEDDDVEGHGFRLRSPSSRGE
jgi:hypothetical protein